MKAPPVTIRRSSPPNAWCLPQQHPARRTSGRQPVKNLFNCNQAVQKEALRRGQRLEFCLKPPLQILKHHGNQTHMRDLVRRRRPAQFGPQRTNARRRLHKITHVSLVPWCLRNLERGLKAKFEALSPSKRFLLDRLIALNNSLPAGAPMCA